MLRDEEVKQEHNKKYQPNVTTMRETTELNTLDYHNETPNPKHISNNLTLDKEINVTEKDVGHESLPSIPYIPAEDDDTTDLDQEFANITESSDSDTDTRGRPKKESR
ncbi:hypothetical protein ILUMI_10125 [Ignelater luminosus]|uniref:Uncharacterized protein n=1 Tax=Ignelater luminosus TaxID=2038154 RepID=A0A8K0G901_IGNLU|nr:hypothetical protein ILUMI_10125 [Ignelater luminosus]